LILKIIIFLGTTIFSSA